MIEEFEMNEGPLPQPSITSMLKANRLMRTLWGETTDKLTREEAELQRVRKTNAFHIEMLKVVDAMINDIEGQQNQRT
jgi:hypothetical protein